ncbi:hypothetical protein G6514_002518 [Epicoccum nigrum]|nr:hypothetical protein G6514_002518 [Epicoccum nigrum]
MELLDLPPEVFQRIVGAYVSVESPRKIGRAHTVCSTFKDYINEELFARQPINKFKGPIGKKLLEKNLASFLSYRTKSLYGAPDFLPSIIRGTSNRLMSFGYLSENRRLSITEKIMQIIIKRSVQLPVRLAIEPTLLQQQDLNNDRMDNIALAMAMYAHFGPTFEAILRQGVDPWGQAMLFKDSIYIATELDDERFVEMLLLATDKNEIGLISKQRRQRQARVMSNALELAVRKGRWTIAERLMTWSAANNAKLPLSAVGSCVKHAISSDNFKFLTKIHELGYFRNAIHKYAEFIVDGLLSNTKPEPALRFCIDHHFFHENSIVSRQYEFSARLLDIAIYEKSVPLVQAAIAVNSYADLSASLRNAIKKRSPSIVCALLDSGVDPEAPMHPPPDQTTCELASGCSEIYNMTRRAIVEKKQALGADYHAPHQKVYTGCGNFDYVAYTFHAPKPEDQI